MHTIRVTATGTGRVVACIPFRVGQLEPPSLIQRLLFWTTVLPNALTDIIDFARGHDPDCTLSCIVPNGLSTAQLDVCLRGSDFQIVCARRLVRGGFPLNPFASEFGANYDLVVTFDGSDSLVSALTRLLRDRYQCRSFHE